MIDTLYSSIDSYSRFCRISSGVASYDMTGRIMFNIKDGAEIADNLRAFHMIPKNSMTDFQIKFLVHDQYYFYYIEMAFDILQIK
jgi:hypothetical protein